MNAANYLHYLLDCFVTYVSSIDRPVLKTNNDISLNIPNILKHQLHLHLHLLTLL